MRYIIPLIALMTIHTDSYSQVKPIRKGWHSLSIQWLLFNKTSLGKVYISEIGDREYSIEGKQRDPKTEDYVTIKGTFLNRGNLLKFNGTIISKINGNNGGQPCELTGLNLFKSSGKRKYWRLQHMLNCDGQTTDYIDIYF
ncbi:hypothetical protein H7U22_22430 [Pedobacter sp. CCM 8938]|uniref:DUF2147 domain-containing protein n=1 Tax=Pedobacter fastidiosus TaxID=2765361 RepID=A0ABR7KYH3_9SPHI|nr:hypothetical protein [Pedobacter fastidiosus]MBC6113179.1 hypothetical protein [Pedobacter fastidiosus]